MNQLLILAHADFDSDASDATESVHVLEHPGSKTLAKTNHLYVPVPTASHVTFLHDGFSTENFNASPTSDNIPCFEHHTNVEPLISLDTLPDNISVSDAQTKSSYRDFYEPLGGSRRSIVFRAVEELFFESLPRRRKHRWMALQHSMKIYPVRAQHQILF